MSQVPEDVLAATPGERARAAADALGDLELTRWCADVIVGRTAYGDPGLPDPGWLAGCAVSSWGAPDRLDAETGYWARVWAARTLLYVWDESVTPEVVAGLEDPAWRVREMCAKVCARWQVAAAAGWCLRLLGDEVPRVRAGALRVLAAVGEGEHTGAVQRALGDPEPAVVAAAERAVKALADRLDRPLT